MKGVIVTQASRGLMLFIVDDSRFHEYLYFAERAKISIFMSAYCHQQ